MKRRLDLSTPRARRGLGVHYDPEAFGRFSEGIARFLGTARFLVMQTVLVFVWITINVFVVVLRWDTYPFILLNLAFSTQAAYAAPLILLAQNRQEARDRQQMEVDRNVAARTQADTEYLAREIASIRLSLADVATTEDLRDQLTGISRTMEDIAQRLDSLEARSAKDPVDEADEADEADES